MAIQMTAVRIAEPGTHAEHIIRLARVDDQTGQHYEGERASWYDRVKNGTRCYDKDPSPAERPI
jgi:hypothetical protein